MTIAVACADLHRAMTLLAQTIEARNTIPILSNVLLRGDADAGMLRLAATNLDQQCEMSCPVEDDATSLAGFATTVDGRRLAAIVAAADVKGRILLKSAAGGGALAVETGRSKYRLPTLPVDDFPLIPKVEGETTFAIRSGDLAALLAGGRRFHCREERRYYLNGADLRIVSAAEDAPAMLRAAATDGVGLHHGWIGAPPGAETLSPIILPSVAADLLIKLLGEAPDNEAMVTVGGYKIGVAAGKTRVTSKLIDGPYPETDRVVPTDRALTATLRVDADALVAAAKRVRLIITEKTRGLVLEASTDGIALKACSSKGGEAIEDVPGEYTGEPIRIGLNAAYLIDIAEAIGPGTIIGRFGDPEAPTLWTREGDNAALAVLMPMRA